MGPSNREFIKPTRECAASCRNCPRRHWTTYQTIYDGSWLYMEAIGRRRTVDLADDCEPVSGGKNQIRRKVYG
jgi:hypothetical protein